MAAALLGLGLLLAGTLRQGAWLIYNPSHSIPFGFYLRHNAEPTRGAIVTVRASEVAGAYAHARGFADASDRFIKRVAAMQGDEVCAHGDEISINGAALVTRLRRDRTGQALPTWEGCVILQDQVLLLGDTNDSFDGRYWGPIDSVRVEAVWRPLGQ
jgi:conjugative transfer signal peptidase TraF